MRKRTPIRKWHPGIQDKKVLKGGNCYPCQILKRVWVRWVRELTVGFCKKVWNLGQNKGGGGWEA